MWVYVSVCLSVSGFIYLICVSTKTNTRQYLVFYGIKQVRHMTLGFGIRDVWESLVIPDPGVHPPASVRARSGHAQDVPRGQSWPADGSRKKGKCCVWLFGWSLGFAGCFFFLHILKYLCGLYLKTIFFLEELLKNSYFEVIYDERTKTRSYWLTLESVSRILPLTKCFMGSRYTRCRRASDCAAPSRSAFDGNTVLFSAAFRPGLLSGNTKCFNFSGSKVTRRYTQAYECSYTPARTHTPPTTIPTTT